MENLKYFYIKKIFIRKFSNCLSAFEAIQDVLVTRPYGKENFILQSKSIL